MPLERRNQDPVTVDLFTRPPEKLTPPPPVEKTPEVPPPPTPEPKERTPARRTPEASPLTPVAPVREPDEPPPSASSETKPPGKVDLTLHALPGGSDNAVTVPSGTGSFGGTLGTGEGGRKPWKMRGDAGNPLTGKLTDEPEDRFPLKAIGGGEFEFKGKAFHARIARDGRVSFDDKSIRDFKGLSGGFDITDLLMRAKGNDPYRAEKQAFLENTESMRKKMAQAALKERVSASLGQLPARLEEIWRDTRRTAKDRRLLLYETWKDAASSEADVGDAAKEACAIVETYVRRYLPVGSEDAYPEEELAQLNRNQRQKFAPYR